MRSRPELFDSVDKATDVPREVWLRYRPEQWSARPGMRLADRDVLGLRNRPHVLTFDRADGLALRAGSHLPSVILTSDARMYGHASIGYAFGSHYWQASASIGREFFDTAAPTRLTIDGHVITDTRDEWKMDALENSVYAGLAGGDARDYFQRRGFGITLEQSLSTRVRVALAYRNDDYRSSRREVGWALFGPSQPFREVPSVREGVMRSMAIRLIADYVTLRGVHQPRFSFALEAEAGAGDATQRIAAFQSFIADVRLRVSMWSDIASVGLHARAGASSGSAPPQRQYTIGGVGTVPGYPQNDYAGHHMYLLRTELLLRPLRRGPLRHICIAVTNDFAAVARATDASNTLSVASPSLRDWKYSPGIDIGTLDGRLRAGVAWRTDVAAMPTFVLRLSRPL